MKLRVVSVVVAMLLIAASIMIMPRPTIESEGEPAIMNQPSGSWFVRWSDHFDDRTGPYDMRRWFTAYDDNDSASEADWGDRVMISDWTHMSANNSLRVNAYSGDSVATWGGDIVAYATTQYFHDWATEKGYWLNFSFRLNTTNNLRFVLVMTVDVFLVIAGSSNQLINNGSTLWSHSAVGVRQFVTELDLAWHNYSICVSCENGDPFKNSESYDLRIDNDDYELNRYSLTDVEPRSILLGDKGNSDVGMMTLPEGFYSHGEGYWDNIVLDYRTVVDEPEVDAGDDQEGLEGQLLNFSGRARGSLYDDYYSYMIGGNDRALNTTSSGQWVTYAERPYSGNLYAVGLLTRGHGTGRAAYAPGDGLAPGANNRHQRYQIFVNAVRWAANTESPPEEISVLMLWGYREIIAYHGPSWNQYRALLAEGFDVTIAPHVPTNETELDTFDVVVQVSSGWTVLPHAQQAHCYNENYSTQSPPQECLQPRGLSESEGELLADYVYGGGGYVASAELTLGQQLNHVANEMDVHFEGNSGATWNAPVVQGQEEHPTLEKWGGARYDIVEYHWDFGNGEEGYGQSVSHGYGKKGVYLVNLTVTDEVNQTAYDTLTVTIENVPPTVNISADPLEVDEGENVTFNGSFDDPSWLDNHTAVWDFGDGWTREGEFSPGPGPGNTHHVMVPTTYAYGKKDTYTACLNVTDEFDGFGQACLNITVNNVAPIVTATVNTTSVKEGSPFTVNGTIYDPSWNDTMSAVWNFLYRDWLGRGPIYPAVITDDPGYGNTTRHVAGQEWDFGDDGNYTIYLNATDGFDVGSDTVNITVENVPPVLINVTTILHLNAPRTHGYWKHQCKVKNPNEDHPGIRQDWIDDIRQQSTYFTDIYTKEDVCDILKPKNPMTWLKQARMQLMALWLNVVSGLLWIDSPLHHPSAPDDDTVREFIQHAETLLNGNPSSTELEWIATIAENINADANDDEPDWAYVDPTVGEYLAYAYDVGSDDLIFIWFDHGNDITHNHYNNPPLPEPDYNPFTNEEKTPEGIYPFQVVDVLVVGYGPDEAVGVEVFLRCLKDDDDGVSDDAKDCPEEAQNPNPLLAVNWSFEFNISYRDISGGFTIAEVTAEYTAYDPQVVPCREGGSFD